MVDPLGTIPPAVQIVLVAGALVGALTAIGAAGVRLYRMVRTVDEHFRRRESERIEQAAGRLIDKAAEAIGGRLDALVDKVEAIDERHQREDQRRQLALADWESWRAGVDAQLDLLTDAVKTTPLHQRHGA